MGAGTSLDSMTSRFRRRCPIGRRYESTAVTRRGARRCSARHRLPASATAMSTVTGLPWPGLGSSRVLVLGSVSVDSQAAAILLARVLLASPFLYSGVDKCWRWSAAQREVAASGLPWPTLLHLVTVVVQLGGGFSLLLG